MAVCARCSARLIEIAKASHVAFSSNPAIPWIGIESAQVIPFERDLTDDLMDPCGRVIVRAAGLRAIALAAIRRAQPGKGKWIGLVAIVEDLIVVPHPEQEGKEMRSRVRQLARSRNPGRRGAVYPPKDLLT